MLESPYLSDETMIEAINNTSVLTDYLLKLILVANPHYTRSDAVMNALEERVPPLPQSMIDEIMLGAEAPSPLEALEADVSYHVHERQNAINLIKREYLTDTVNNYNTDSLLALLGREEYINAQYQKAFVYLASEDYQAFDQLVSSLASFHDGSEYRTSQYDEYDTFFEIIRDMLENNKSYSELENSQKTDLENLADNGEFLPAAYARAILIKEKEGYSYQEPVILPVVNPQRIRNVQPDNPHSKLKVFPNPASNYLVAEFETIVGNTSKLVVTDISGKIVLEVELEATSTEKVIDCSRWSDGIYQVSLLNNDVVVESVKLSIVN
jgi:hypothetical protein